MTRCTICNAAEQKLAEQASALAFPLAQLRHLYRNLVSGQVRDAGTAKEIAEGLLLRQIEQLEKIQAALAATKGDQ